MAEERKFVSRTVYTRKYVDRRTPPLSVRPPQGFSAPVASPSPDSSHAAPPNSNVLLPFKKRWNMIADPLPSDADTKRPRLESVDETNNQDFSSAPMDVGLKHPIAHSQVGMVPPSVLPVTNDVWRKKINIPNGMVRFIIGKGGETAKYLQLQSGAEIQVTKYMDADPTSQTTPVDLMGAPDNICKAEQLINDVLSQAGLIIGEGGETIRNMQARSGAHIQVTLIVIGNDFVQNRVSNPPLTGGYHQQGYPPPWPPKSWAPPRFHPMQQPGFSDMQPGAYPGQPLQYHITQPPYARYPPKPTSSGSSSGSVYYDQQQQAHGSSLTPADNTSYSHSPSGYTQQGAYGVPNYGQAPTGQQTSCPQYGSGGGYHVPVPHFSYGQSLSNPQPGYDQQQGYNSLPIYGTMVNPIHVQDEDEAASSSGAQGGPAQVPPDSSEATFTCIFLRWSCQDF
ncbi:hypothetical protein HHK36_021757 [Tetracentron sinense]|uniref:K Homology domain-containing protein n=1 Tax=Tetracentron sinense TaxID=13715 RepID=A0A835D7D2_TETSI|nr:hypothetical protein HHK36_021757 [Tetracentron sinense]